MLPNLEWFLSRMQCLVPFQMLRCPELLVASLARANVSTSRVWQMYPEMCLQMAFTKITVSTGGADKGPLRAALNTSVIHFCTML